MLRDACWMIVMIVCARVRLTVPANASASGTADKPAAADDAAAEPDDDDAADEAAAAPASDEVSVTESVEDEFCDLPLSGNEEDAAADADFAEVSVTVSRDSCDLCSESESDQN